MKHDSRIAVTGANGLAGSAVVEYLRDRGYEKVFPITRQMTDLRNSDDTLDRFVQLKPEYVFHAAATVYGLQGNMDNQFKSIMDNTMINTNVIGSAHAVRSVRKIVVMGTNAIYPWPADLPYREETIFDGRPHDGEAGYGHAKRHMLAMLEASGLDYAYLVSGNLYGPRDTFNVTTGHVLPSLIKKFYDASLDPDEVVSIWGDGSATRDFLYSEDLASIVTFVMDNEFKGAINIGSGNTCSIEYIAKRLSAISGVGYDRVVYDTTKPRGRPDCYADLSKLRGLGWQPRFTITSGLEDTYEWYSRSRAA